MLNYSCNTPGIYLIFGVSVLRYYHVCKPHLIYTIHTKMKLFCICVLIITLCVAVIFATCAIRKPWPTEELPGFECVYDEDTKSKCALAIKFSLTFIILSYIFCLNGMIGLNFRILQRMVRQRKIMSRYKNVRKNKHSQIKQEQNVKNASKSESIAETIESQHTSINDLNDILDSKFNANDISIKDYFSFKTKSTKSEDNESCDVSLNLQEKTDNFIEHHRETQRNTSKIKSKGKSIQLNKDQEKDIGKHLSGKKEGFSLFDNIKTTSIKNGAAQKEYKEGDSSKSERCSIGSMSVKHNDSVKTDGHDHDNKQSCHTKVISFPNKGNNADKINEKRLERHQEKHYGKYYWHKFTSFFKFEGFNRTSLKLSFVSIAYIVFYAPWFILQVYALFEPNLVRSSNYDTKKYIIYPISFFPFAGCALNPVIYAFVDPKFRSQCRALFQ